MADHLRLPCWTFRKDHGSHRRLAGRGEPAVPVLLSDRRDQLAGDLSGGEQQQLALAMTLLLRPRVLLIDELSLGPVAHDRGSALCDVVRELNRNGMTVVVVEQSVNVALTLAERAVFMEKGTVRFEGPTRELLDRPDLLRSVFIDGSPVSQRRRGSMTSTPCSTTSTWPAWTDRRSTRYAAGHRRAGPGLLRRHASGSEGCHALSDVDLVVNPGEIVGLIGQNGAGKTTLMDCISGFHTVDEGTITFRGVDVTGLGTLRAGPWSHGPDLPGSAAVPVADRRRRRSRWPASATSPAGRWSPTPPVSPPRTSPRT